MVQNRLRACRLIYAIPDGTKCFVCASERKTVIRDKCGYLLEHINTLLPNGNSLSTETGKTMLQGVYSKRDKTVYLTDVLMWNDDLMIDSVAELRLIMLVNKVRENPVITNTLSPSNQVMFRMPQMLDCSKSSLDLMYYGLYRHVSETNFAPSYELLLNYIKVHGLESAVGVLNADLRCAETALKVCCAFGYDNVEAPYLKDGLAFVHKEGIFFLGYTASMLQWKDVNVSPRYSALLREPMLAYLYLNKDRKLQTHDGYIIDKSDPAIEKLKVDQTYEFSYTNIYLNDPYATLEGLTFVRQCDKPVWSAMSHLVFRILARKNMLPYGVLSQQVLTEELNKKVAHC